MSVADFQHIFEQIFAARKSGNVEEVKKFATADVLFFGPSHDPFNAQQSIEHFKKEHENNTKNKDLKFHVDDAKIHNDTAVTNASLSMTTTHGPVNGWNLTTWINKDGQWKINRSMTTIRIPKA